MRSTIQLIILNVTFLLLYIINNDKSSHCFFIARSDFTASSLFHSYHNYDELVKKLKEFAIYFPDNVYLYTIGDSVEERQLLVVALAHSNPHEHQILRPEVKYVANMHGNEASGRELLIQFIDYMLNYQFIDPNVDYIMKNMRTHVLVSMNPDGFERATMNDCGEVDGRHNANNYDLNRNFPDLYECARDDMDVQPETQSVINWMNNNNFILSANFHSGSVVVNYPFDTEKYENQLYSKADDDDIFRDIASTYAANHMTMKSTTECGRFEGGITNGGIIIYFLLFL
jgi:hypothetical protein